MNKSKTRHLFNILFITSIIAVTMIWGCGSTNSGDSTETIVIGLNFEMTGDLPEVGLASQQAVELFLESRESSEGIEIAGTTYQIDTELIDNKATEEGATLAASEFITDENILAMIGPNPSYQAVPIGQLANESELVMISPWSSNVQTTLYRPWVFRVSFVDSFQGVVLAQFAKSQYDAVNACVLYADDSAYPTGLSESFIAEWKTLNGTIAANETFQTGDKDLNPQLTNIKNANCEFLLLPQYANEVPSIIEQAQAMGITVPILGGDAWSSQTLLDECGDACEGYFLSKQYVPSGATGSAEDFINNYQEKYGEIPDDVAALTWDAMLLIEQALKNCGNITGNLTEDRACLRDGLAMVQGLEGVTGPITFDENGDPQKCVAIIKIVDNEFTYFDTVCPE